MHSELIAVSQYCLSYDISPDFIASLQEGGLIEIVIVAEEKFVDASQLPELEKYTRWYQELDINVEGIDTIRHLLQRMHDMHREIHALKNRLRLYETGEEF